MSIAYGSSNVNAPAGYGRGLQLRTLESAERKHGTVNVKDFPLRIFSNINGYEVRKINTRP